MFLTVVSVSSGRAHQLDSVGGGAVVGAVGDVHGSLWACVLAAFKATAPPAGRTRHLYAQSPQWRGPHIWGKNLLLSDIHSSLSSSLICNELVK